MSISQAVKTNRIAIFMKFTFANAWKAAACLHTCF
jgi:hypothetical protein